MRALKPEGPVLNSHVREDVEWCFEIVARPKVRNKEPDEEEVSVVRA